MMANVAVRNLIREDKVYQIPSIIQAGGKSGMQSTFGGGAKGG
jgi:Tfp pilus assembly pilus retraction ATPase PilT